ncbi:hypothetical protein [Bradyrhizobium sp. BR 1432]|uniref:hypothetical protein n=1 Tax=Bradyrhizobium sp. BR 1432 TaxID=3447966 RepID=UPI003EE457B1
MIDLLAQRMTTVIFFISACDTAVFARQLRGISGTVDSCGAQKAIARGVVRRSFEPS